MGNFFYADNAPYGQVFKPEWDMSFVKGMEQAEGLETWKLIQDLGAKAMMSSGITIIPFASDLPKGKKVPFDQGRRYATVDLGQVVLTAKKFDTGFRVPRGPINAQMVDYIKGQTSEFPKVLMENWSDLLTDFWVRAAAGTIKAPSDGVNYFSASHKYVNANGTVVSTLTNLLSGNGMANITAIEKDIQAVKSTFAKMFNYGGVRTWGSTLLEPKMKFLVAPSYADLFRQVLYANFNAASTTLQQYKQTIDVIPFAPFDDGTWDADDWVALLDSGNTAKRPFFYGVAQEPLMDPVWIDYTRDEECYGATFYPAIGPAQWKSAICVNNS